MPQHKLCFLPGYRNRSPLVVSDGRTVLAVFQNQNPFGKSFAHFSRMRSSSALLERAMTGKVFLRRNGMQASIITRELRRSVSVASHIGSSAVLHTPWMI